MPNRFSPDAVSRRAVLAMGAGAAAVAGAGRAPATTTALSPITAGVSPIGAEERGARIAKLQRLMQQQGIAAFLVEAGSSLEYFTGVRWWRSERTTAALIPAEGQPVIVTPFFEEPSIRESLQVPGDVRSWKEDESPSLCSQAPCMTVPPRARLPSRARRVTSSSIR